VGYIFLLKSIEVSTVICTLWCA